MRLPISKVWRAFPELDRFDDARCRRYVREAARSHRRSVLLLVLLLPVGALMWLLSIGLSVALLDLLVPGKSDPHLVFMVAAALAFGAPPFVIGTLLLVARDRWLRRAIRGRLNIARCLGCSYSLLGLEPFEDDAGQRCVVCPECGRPGEVTDEMLEQMRELAVV